MDKQLENIAEGVGIMEQRYEVRDLRRHDWFSVDNIIIKEYGNQIGVYGIAVYSALCMHARNDTQECWPSHVTIARELACSVSKVKELVGVLESLKLIAIEPRFGEDGRQTSNLYILLTPPVTTDTRPPYPTKLLTKPIGTKPNSIPQHQLSTIDVGPAVPDDTIPFCDPPIQEIDMAEEEPANEGDRKNPPKNPQPPAVKAFRTAAHRFPAKSWWAEIDKVVGTNEKVLAKWQQIVHDWVGMGWNPVNIKGMLEAYRNGGIKPRAAPADNSMIGWVSWD